MDFAKNGSNMSSYQSKLMTCRLNLIIVILFICLGAPATLMAKGDLVLNTAFGHPLSNDEQTGFADMVVNHALAQLDLKMESVKLPAERALLNANAGIDDGDLLRIEGIEKTYPNLIQVPEKIIDIEFVVFTKQPQFTLSDWQSLKPYSIAIINGWKILERNITDVAELTKVKNEDQLFTILSKNRVDAIVYSRWTGLAYITQHNLQGVYMVKPPIAQRSLYIYLHKKHKNLVPKLSQALKSMKLDGSYQRLYEQKLLSVFGK